MDFLRAWLRRPFSDPQVVILAALLVAGLVLLVTVGEMLAPVIAAVVIAYLLDRPVEFLARHGMPRPAAVAVVFVVFLAALFAAFLLFLPLLFRQVAQLVQELPTMLASGQEALMRLPSLYPELVDEAQMRGLINLIRNDLLRLGQRVLSYSVSSLLTAATLLVYLVLLPMLVFFFLKDKWRILGWLVRYVPAESGLAAQVWREVDLKTGNYVRGKVYEIAIVGVASYLVFVALDLEFAALLATLTGLSVLVPYIGAVVASVPVTLVAYFQWGWESEFLWVVGAYWIIQTIDGNVLAPILFAEVINLHPTAIIVAVLVFGGIWGFWGVFFAIPLATLVQAVLNAWPKPPAARVEGARRSPARDPALSAPEAARRE